jgi:Zn-dependent oligopeptidase
MELWLQNDGFVKRLGVLSQDKYTFPEDLMEILRKETVNQKAEEIMQNVFLGSLESNIFTNFDPRGDETLVALQGRLAKKYVPHNLPDTDDMSPLLQVFQENAAIDQKRMTAYNYLWSEILSANVYDKLSKTDMNDKVEVKRLGRAVRNLFLRENDTNLTMQDFEDLCGKQISSQALQDIYNF